MSTKHQEVSDEIIAKLQKILRLAHGKGAAQGEIESALLRAKEIAQRHQIDLATISLEDPKSKSSLNIEIKREGLRCRSESIQIYHKAIWEVYRKVFGVRTIYFSKKSPMFVFVGEVTDVLICKELFSWLEDVFYSAYYKAKKEGIVESCAASKRGIYWGMANGIIEANKRDEPKLDKKEQECLALVVRKKEDLIEEELKGVRKVKDRSHGIDPYAFEHGENEGRKIKLAQVVSPTAKSQLR